MSASERPTLASGKICYIEIPATDIDRSAEFYSRAFGWRIRRRDDGAVAFDDAVNEVSGTWVLERPPSPQPGLMIHIMVADIAAAVDAVRAAGGEIVQPVEADQTERLARFQDPAGNVLGIYEQPGLARAGPTGRRACDEEVDPIPEHLGTVTPRLVVASGVEAIDFYRRAFDAEQLGEPFTGPDGQIIHAELRIGDSIVMITEDAADGDPDSSSRGAGGGAIMATYWEDVDAVWERALRAGAEVIYPLADHFYGERGGRLRDPFGQQWMLSRQIEKLTSEEVVRRAAERSDSSAR